MLSEEQLTIYQRDGVVRVRHLCDAQWLAELRRAADAAWSNPGPLAFDFGAKSHSGRFFTDHFVWLRHATFRRFTHEGCARKIAAQVVGVPRLILLSDHLWIKGPHSTAPSILHHDLPYWPIWGKQICTVWVALSETTRTCGGLEFIRGSHRWGKQYFHRRIDYERSQCGEPRRYQRLPSLDDISSPDQRISHDLEAGDCLIIHPEIVHWAPGNTTQRFRSGYAIRYCGDDVVWTPRPHCVPMPADPGLTPGAPLECDLFPLVWETSRSHQA